jgi:hypothetical protein
MTPIHKVFQVILNFMEVSSLGENAQVNVMIEKILKSLLTYLENVAQTHMYV